MQITERSQGIPLSNFFGLVATNVFVIALAVYQAWDIGQLVWVYIGQSIIIGIFTVWRVARTELYTMRTTGDVKTKTGAALAFAFAFSFMHLIYIAFLLSKEKAALENITPLLLCLGVFLLDRSLYYKNVMHRQKESFVEIGSIIGVPFLRVVVMHFVLILGFIIETQSFSLVFIITVKTLGDMLFEYIEFRILPLEEKI